MKYYLDNKEVTLKQLKQAVEKAKECNCYFIYVIALEKIENNAFYFETSTYSIN